MEHIANVTGNHPIDVRMANMKKEDNPIPDLINDLKKVSDYSNREKKIEEFNKVRFIQYLIF